MGIAAALHHPLPGYDRQCGIQPSAMIRHPCSNRPYRPKSNERIITGVLFFPFFLLISS